MSGETTIEDVERYLSSLKQKIKTFNIIFRDERGKNSQTLLDLEITPKYREEVIQNIEPIDYIDGPLPETLNGLDDMWVFGKTVKNKEVYIKITLNKANRPVICISFHIAEKNLKYKFK